MKKIGLYIHIPFCVKKCNYCNFCSVVGNPELMEEYLRALVLEIKTKSLKISKEIEINSIYIGGGTPSILPPGYISTLMQTVKSCFKLTNNCEISMEANPNSITYDKALEWFESGIRRMSVGLQSCRNNLLRLIGRSHNKQDYINAMNILKRAGFKNINTDIIIALPKQKMSDVKQSVRFAVKNGSTHISAYSLILEENTPLYESVNRGVVKLPKEEKAVNMYTKTVELLKEFGFKRYEVSNFCKTGFYCQHNLNCWKGEEYLGFGLSAHGYYNSIRYYNVDNIKHYIEKVFVYGNAVDVSENISNSEKIEEAIMLGLRTTKGVNLNELKTLGCDLMKSKQKEIEFLKNNKLIEYNKTYLCATDAGFYVLNQIILKLI